MFKRRKLKSFGVKVISFDSELEFFLDVSHCHQLAMRNNKCLIFIHRDVPLEVTYSTLYVERLV